MNKLFFLIGVLLLQLSTAVEEEAPTLDITSEEEVILHEVGDFKITINQSEKEKLGGKKPTVGDKISVHYRGKFVDGNEFDSSFKRNRPFLFDVGQGRVIKCWDQAFLQLTKGMKATLYCPAEYAYGSSGAGRIIPPNSDLIFDVELIDINAPPPEEPTETSKSKRRKKKSKWEDLPPVGDDSTHQCFEPMYF